MAAVPFWRSALSVARRDLARGTVTRRAGRLYLRAICLGEALDPVLDCRRAGAPAAAPGRWRTVPRRPRRAGVQGPVGRTGSGRPPRRDQRGRGRIRQGGDFPPSTRRRGGGGARRGSRPGSAPDVSRARHPSRHHGAVGRNRAVCRNRIAWISRPPAGRAACRSPATNDPGPG